MREAVVHADVAMVAAREAHEQALAEVAELETEVEEAAARVDESALGMSVASAL